MSLRVTPSYIGIILSTAFLAFVPVFVDSVYILGILVLCLMYAVLAASWDLLSGYTGQISFGHAAFFGVGAYTSAILSLRLGIPPWAGLPLGGSFSALLGLILGLPCLRLRGPYLALATFAFASAVEAIVNSWVPVTKGPSGLTGYPALPSIFSSIVPYYLALIFFLVSITIMLGLMRSRLGLIFRAIREDEVKAESSGVDTTYYKVVAFVLSSFIAGLTGGFYAYYMGLITPLLLSLTVTVNVIGMAIIGGKSSILGPVMGAFAFILLSELLRPVGVVLNLIILGALLMIIILVLPDGVYSLIPKKFK